jgi:hypothetical protein
MSGKSFLLVGGFNNEPDTAGLAVIDEARPFAASPQTSGTRHECVSCPQGVPDYYFVFPRSEITGVKEIHEESVLRLNVTESQIEVVKGSAMDTDTSRVHYVLRADDGFRPISVRFNSGYDSEHRKLEKEGKLRHSLEECPELLHPKPVRLWRPTSGWTEIQIAPTRADQ